MNVVWIQRVGFWAGITGILSFFVGLATLVVDVRRDVRQVQQGVERVEAQTRRGTFQIEYPYSGAIVELTDFVRVYTPFDDSRVYILVTPLQTGDDWIQDEPTHLVAGRTWVGQAQFGNADAGAGERFIVRAISTQSHLESGALTNVPSDAVFSDAVYVKRRGQENANPTAFDTRHLSYPTSSPSAVGANGGPNN